MVNEITQKQRLEDKNLAIKINHEVNWQAADKQFYGDAVALGDHAAHAMSQLKGQSHRSQLTGLENIAESTLKVTDIFDYIKRQTARYPYWRTAFPSHSREIFGERLRSYLENDLVRVRDRACDDTHLKIGNQTDKDRQLRHHVYMVLIRQFIRQMVVQYEYRVSFSEQGNHNGAGKR